MNYQGAKIFLSIVEHQSISAAARALYITQPAVSAQLKTLEDELGVQLFHRDNPLSLTEAGRRQWEENVREWENTRELLNALIATEEE